MRIALVAPFDEPVPPRAYGGAEVVIANLANQFVQLGHDVYLLASGDSTAPGNLLPVFAKSVRHREKMVNRRELYWQTGMAHIVSLLQETSLDIVHNHLGWRLLPFSGLIGLPMVTTLHGPLHDEGQRSYYAPFKQDNFVSISKNQRKGMPSLHFVANIYNGVDLDSFQIGDKPRKYLAFLGRISPEKGILEAIRVAQTAHLPLIIAAKVDTVDQDYFHAEIEPLIDGRQIRFIGEINQRQKTAFLQQTIALLMPIQWEEPFGLVSIEAMASGTPVLGFNRGSLPEIIQNGVNGYLCTDIANMAQRVTDARRLDPRSCRAVVEQKFSARRMALQYLRTYEHLVKRSHQQERTAVKVST